MFTIKKILVPTDFSDNATKAYNMAHEMAARFGAKVDFIHVIQTLHYFNKSIAKLDLPLHMDEDLYPQLKNQASHRINELMDDYLKPENKGKGIVQIAPKPSKAIAEHAERGDYDLVLMATLGEHESNFLIGSVAEKVIRYSTIPVLSTGKSDLDDIQKILVPTDGSQMSLKALPLAISLALAFNSEIVLFHVQELYASLSEKVLKDPSKPDDENIRNAIYAELETFFSYSWDQVELRKGEGFESQFIYYEGASNISIDVTTVIKKRISAHNTITEYAGEFADIVIMATHGRGGLAHLFLGSTTEKVARHLKIPVLTVTPGFDEMPNEG